MPVERQQTPWLPRSFFENRARFPQEELDKYSGMHVAYNWEGNTILASALTLEELFAQLDAARIDTSRVVLSFVE